MRLDEWQKYIDTQFLADEPAEVKTAATEPISVPAVTVSSDLVSSDLVSSDLVSSEPVEPASVHFKPTEPLKPSAAAEPSSSIPTQASDIGHHAINNMLTMVVGPSSVLQATPSERLPRIELLTPLPEPAANSNINSVIINSIEEPIQSRITAETTSASSKPSPETTNRTRRRSQNIHAASNVNAPISEGSANSKQFFRPLTDLDTDIPAFQSYLPSSHAASRPAETDIPQQLELLTEIYEPEDFKHIGFEIAELDSNKAIVGNTETSVEIEDSAAEFSIVTEYDLDTAATNPDLTELAPETSIRRLPGSRAKNARNVRPESLSSGLTASELWAQVPRHVQTLLSLERLEEKEVAQSSYKRQFQEKRHELIERLLDPILSLEDTARLLNVCPTTVRRYTNKGILTYYRKEPERTARQLAAGQLQDENQSQADKETRQRRFRLSDILTFLETQRAAIEVDRLKEQQ